MKKKTNDYENFEKGMIYMKILKKGGIVEKRGEEETKSMPRAPVINICIVLYSVEDIVTYAENIIALLQSLYWSE